MKTSEAQEVRKVDDGTQVESHLPPPASAPRSTTGLALRRAMIGVLALLVIAAVTVVVAWVASSTAVEQPATEDSQLLDRSVRARDPVAANAQRDTLLDRSVRARDPVAANAQRDTLLDRSVRARDPVAANAQRDTLLDRSVRARDR
jgi:hypothetical protein